VRDARWAHRTRAGYVAFAIHRLSGLLLTLFLPFHFWTLGQAIEGEADLDAFLRWAEHPLVKLGETALVALLALHLGGGLRLLALEWQGWREWQRNALAVIVAFGTAAGILFLLNVMHWP
jgi:fumarate reductase subunit D